MEVVTKSFFFLLFLFFLFGMVELDEPDESDKSDEADDDDGGDSIFLIIGLFITGEGMVTEHINIETT